MRNFFILLVLLLNTAGKSGAQELKTKNLIIVTLDGLRWQEIFQGADSALLFNKEYVSDDKVVDYYWRHTSEERRKVLTPFLWSVVEEQGQLLGNRTFNNKVDCANPFWFSYPGYSELFTGFVDKRIRSNAAKENPNRTVLDFIQQQPKFNGKVAGFATWEVMSSVIREKSGGIPVNSGREFATGQISQTERLLNELQELLPTPHGGRYDALTFFYALEYLKRTRSSVIYIGFDETDQHAHSGRYDEYLKAATRNDRMIATLWYWLQSQDDFHDKTSLIITTDHGRGRSSNKGWKSHGRLAFGSGETLDCCFRPRYTKSGRN
jgi:hypothetical protein